MMMEPTLVIALTSLVGICVVALALLRAWQGWLQLKRDQIERGHVGHNSSHNGGEIEGGAGVGAARIELADMKERIRKLEAIAAGVEL